MASMHKRHMSKSAAQTPQRSQTTTVEGTLGLESFKRRKDGDKKEYIYLEWICKDLSKKNAHK